MTVSRTFLVFDDLDSFEYYWSDILLNVHQLGFVEFFPYDWTGVIGFGEEDYRGKVPLSS